MLAEARKPEWLVGGMIVARQPGVFGAPKKSLKTSINIDLMVSLGSCTPFLGHFKVYRQVRAAMLSGESGDWATAETVKRVCAARGVRPEDVDCLWDFNLPQLACPAHVKALAEALKERHREVLLLDPLYLALLAGQRDLKASNLFDVGPLLKAVAEECLAVGCTPLLTHHTVKGSSPASR